MWIILDFNPDAYETDIKNTVFALLNLTLIFQIWLDYSKYVGLDPQEASLHIKYAFVHVKFMKPKIGLTVLIFDISDLR